MSLLTLGIPGVLELSAKNDQEQIQIFPEPWYRARKKDPNDQNSGWGWRTGVRDLKISLTIIKRL